MPVVDAGATRSNVSKIVIGVRTILYQLAVVGLVLAFVPTAPLFFTSDRRRARGLILSFLGVLRLLLRWIAGIDERIEGVENLPPGPYLLASRHESAWEVLFFPLFFDDPAAFAKQEIFANPLGGLFARIGGHIAIDRGGDLAGLKAAFEAARQTVAGGRSILIFPSGTRHVDGRDRIQPGVTALYELLKVPCVPVTLDSGRCWPPGSWLRYPGTIRVRIGPPIAAGLDRRRFMAELREGLGLDPEAVGRPAASASVAPPPAATSP